MFKKKRKGIGSNNAGLPQYKPAKVKEEIIVPSSSRTPLKVKPFL